jgi:hypothetical protein
MARSSRTRKGTQVGRYVPAEQSGRYTRPIPKDTRRSAWWFGYLVVGLLCLGALLLVGNYLSFLPGATNSWYLVGGLVAIVAGFALSTRLR